MLRLVFGIAIVGAFAYLGYTDHSAPEAQSYGGPMPVMVAPVASLDYQPSFDFSGRLSAITHAEVRPQVSGMVEEIHYKEGDIVTQGQPLFSLDLRTYKAGLQQSEAQLDKTRLAYERSKKLSEEGFLSQAEVETRLAAYREAEAANTQAQVNLDHAVLKAPISGRVGRPDVTIGNVVTAGLGAPLMTTIQQLDPLYVDFELNEQSYLRLLTIQPDGTPQLTDAQVSVGLATDGTDYPLNATLTAVDNKLDVASGSLRLRATLQNPTGALLPGLFARVRVTVPVSQTSLFVNEAAIGTDQANRFVWKMGADNKPEYARVTLGPVVNGLRAVSSPTLSAGDRVIVNGLMRVRPGAPVMPVPADMTTLQPLSAPGGDGTKG